MAGAGRARDCSGARAAGWLAGPALAQQGSRRKDEVMQHPGLRSQAGPPPPRLRLPGRWAGGGGGGDRAGAARGGRGRRRRRRERNDDERPTAAEHGGRGAAEAGRQWPAGGGAGCSAPRGAAGWSWGRDVGRVPLGGGNGPHVDLARGAGPRSGDAGAIPVYLGSEGEGPTPKCARGSWGPDGGRLRPGQQRGRQGQEPGDD